ncbi:MAG: glycosyltransferase [archaeon]|nr:glycosyltransferase [archaeon]
MKLFLSHAGIGEVTGGVEVYAQHLASAFPDLKLVDYHSIKSELGDTWNPLVREPERARLLGEHVSQKFPDAEAVFTNGMFCWNLPHKNQFNIIHGTYAAFAQSAMPKTNPDYWRLKFVYNNFEKKAAQNAGVCVANSRQTQGNAKKFLGIDAKIIYPPVDPLVFKPDGQKKCAEKLGWSGTNILFVGRPEHAKGFDLIEGLAEKNPGCNFKCLLSRPYSTNQKNIEVIPAVGHASLPLYYNAADAVLFPSLFEGFGLVIAEALSCGKKIVCLNTGIANELDSGNIFRAKPSIPSLDSTLKSCLRAKEQDSHALVKEKFSTKNFTRKWKSLLGQ